MRAMQNRYRSSVKLLSYSLMALFLVACQESKVSNHSPAALNSAQSSPVESGSLGSSSARSEETKSEPSAKSEAGDETADSDDNSSRGEPPRSNGNGGAGFGVLFLGMAGIMYGWAYLDWRSKEKKRREEAASLEVQTEPIDQDEDFELKKEDCEKDEEETLKLIEEVQASTSM